MFELWRRIALVAGITIAVCLNWYVDFSPRITVEKVNFQQEQREISGFGFFTEKKRYLASLPLQKYIAEITEGQLLTADEGVGRFAVMARAAIDGVSHIEDWSGYVAENSVLWFHLKDFPLPAAIPKLATQSEHLLYLSPEEPGNPDYLMLRLHRYGIDDYAIGEGFMGGAMPPIYDFYPFRRWAWLTALSGLLCYLFLPWQKREAGVMRFPRHLNMIGDAVSMLLFIPFFVLPILLAGAIQVIPVWSLFALFLWPLALSGLVVTKINGWYSAFRGDFIPGGIHLRALDFDQKISYAALKRVSPAILKSPMWLKTLLTFGAFAANGADRYRMAGQALIVGSFQQAGLRFEFKDGRSFFLWTVGQNGKPMFSEHDRLMEEILATGLFDDSEVIEKRALSSESKMEPGGKQGFSSLQKIVLTPLAIVLLFLLAGFLFGQDDGNLISSLTQADRNQAGEPFRRPVSSMAELSATERLWQLTIPGGRTSYGELLSLNGKGEIISAGRRYEGRADIQLVKADPSGQLIWQKQFGDQRHEQPNGLTVLPDGSILVAGTQSPSGGSYRDIYLFKISEKGDLQWETVIGKQEAEESVIAMTALANGDFLVLAEINREPVLMKRDSLGKSLSNIPLSGRIKQGWEQSVRLDVKDMISATDGDLVVCGELEKSGVGFKNAFMVKMDVEGNVRWKHEYGAEGRQGANKVRELPDGGFLLAGYSGLFGEGKEDILAIRIDPLGTTVWERTFGGPDDDSAQAVAILPDGSAMLLARSTFPQTSLSYTPLYLIDTQGNVSWRRQPGRNIEGIDLVHTAEGRFVLTGQIATGNSNSFQGEQLLLEFIPRLQ